MTSLLRYSLLIGKLLTISILSMAQVSVDNTIDQHISCPNGNDGQITVSISGMVVGNYYVQWENTDEGTTDFRVITLPKTTVIFPDEGDGNVSITSGSHTVTVIKLTAPVEVVSKSISVREPDVLDYTVTQPTCALSTGTIEIDSPVDDKGVYSFEYSINGGATYQASPLFEGLSDGNYDIRVRVTSHTDCFLTDVVTINPPPTPLAEPTLDVTQPTCAEPTGTIEVLSPTGIDLEYARNVMGPWQDATTFSALAADNIYTIFVRRKSDNTCLNSKSVSINPAPSTPPAPTATSSDATCAGGGSIQVTSPLGAEYEYSIDGAAYQASTTFSDVAPGTYGVTVRPVADPLCVSAPTSVTVNAAAGAPVIESTSHADPTTAGGTEGTITVNLVVGTGSPNYVYYLTDNLGNPVANSVSTGAETYQFTGLSAGNYTVYVTDNASCTSASVTGIILEDPVGCTDAVITLTSGNDIQTVCQDESIVDIVYSIAGDFGAVNVAGLPNGVSGSLVGTTYTLSGTPTEFGLFNYTVTVDGSGGCLGDNASGTIDVTEPTVPTFDQLGPYCLGDVADALPGTSTNGITGSWSPATISTATAGTMVYSFTPDAGQCATITSMSVNVNEAPQNVNAGPDVSICEGESTQLQGSADLPTNNNVVFSEDFTGTASGALPAGWTRNSTLWGGMNSSLAGGTAPELALLSDFDNTDKVYRVNTPLISAVDNQLLELSFNHSVDHWNGSYRLAVQTSTDGVNWTNQWEFYWPGSAGGDIAPTGVTVDLSSMDDQSFYLAYTYTGKLRNITHWAVDDIELTGLMADPVSILWSPAAGLSDPTIFDPIATPAATTTYTLTVGIGGCENSDQVTVTVEPIVAPVFSLDPTYTHCIGDSPVVLPTTSDNGITGTWSPSEISTDTPGLTTYTFTPDPGECATETTIDVEVKDLPTATMSGGGDYCEGADPTGVDVQIDLTGEGPWTIRIAVDGAERNLIANASPFILEDVGEGHFTMISVEDQNCTGTFSGEAFVVEIPAPTATITGGGDYCAGTNPTGVDVSVELTGTAPWSLVYAIDGVNQPMVTGVAASPYIISNATLGEYTLTSVSDAACDGSVSGTVTVAELPVPTAEISGGGSYCAGVTPSGVDVSIELIGTAPWSVIYAIDGTDQPQVTEILSSPYVISDATAGEYTLSFVDDDTGCAGSLNGTATVVENPLPTAEISGGGSYCTGASPTGVDVTIELTGNSTWTVVYAIDGIDQAPIAGIASSPYILQDVTEGTYTLTSVVDANCTGTVSGSGTVIENPQPNATLSGGGDYCAGTNPTGIDLTIDLTGTTPWSLVYAIDGVDQTEVTGITTSPYTLSDVTAGEFTLSAVTDANCDGTVSGTATVNELALPTAAISGGGSYCAGTSPTGVDIAIDLTGVGPWSVVYAIGGVEQAPISGIATSPYTIANAGAGEYTLVSVVDANCTGTVSGSASVIENPLPTAEISGGGSYCAGTSPTGIDVNIDLTGSGLWTVVYAIDGVDQAPITDIASSPFTLEDVIEGEYTLVSVVDANCTGTVSGSATVVENALPTAEISGGGSYCAGTSPTGVDVSIDLTGTAPWTVIYAIDGVEQAPIENILSSPFVLEDVTAGEYTLVSVEDLNCSGTLTGNASVVEHELPTAEMSGGGQYCAGTDPTGIDVQIDLTGESPWVIRIAVDGSERNVIANATPFIMEDVGEGHFTIISVVDANCVGTVSGEAWVIELPLPTATISGGGSYCAGTNPTGVDVVIDLTGPGPWDVVYAIDGVDQPVITEITTSPYTITNALEGVYTLTSVADASCDGTVGGSATVTELPLPTAEISGGGEYCEGVSPTGINLSIDLTGTDPWTIIYAIDGVDQAAITGITTSPYVIVDATAGDYTLTSVEDATGCSGTVSGLASVIENPLPTAEISGGGSYCSGVTPSGVDVTIDLTGNGLWTVVYAIDGVEQAPLSGIASSPYVLEDVTEGLYTLVSVVDDNCTGTVSGSATVVENPLPTAEISGGGSYCAGTSPTGVDVSIELTGTAPWTVVYAIDGTDQPIVSNILVSPFVISDALAGEYTLVSVDDASCSGTVSGSASVIELELPTATMSGGGQYCIGADPTGVDVQIDFTGESPWVVRVAVDGSERNVLVNASPFVMEDVGEGHFTIISVSDANCTGTVSGEAFVIEIATAAPTGDATQEFCAGATIADIVVTGEAITWYDAPGGNVLTSDYVLVDGETYYATQTAEGCESQDNLAVTATVYEQLAINIIDVKHGRCDNPNAGSIEVQGLGGTLPYTYTLFDDLDNQVGLPIDAADANPVTFTDLEPGTYYVIFEDASVCAQATTADIVINEPIPVSITEIDLTNNHCFGDTNAEVIITATGGEGDLTYWFEDSDGVIIYGPQVNDAVFTGLSDGNYTIVVEGENGCVDTYVLEIVGPDELGVETEVTSIACADDGNVGQIRARATGGTAPFTITLFIDGVEQAQFTGIGYNTWVEFINLAPDNRYEVVVNDRWSCGPATTALLEITIPDPLLIGAPIAQDVTCFGQSNGEVTVSASGGVSPYTFTLYDGNDVALASLTDAAEVTFVNLLAGNNLYITVVDDNSCGPVSTPPFNLDEPDPIAIDVNSIVVDDITCNGSADGQISLSASGGTGDLYFTLTTGGVALGAPQVGSGVFEDLSAGIYVIEITDDLNCGPVFSDAYSISEPVALNVSITSNNPLCSGDVGSIAVTVSNGTEPYSISLLKSGVEEEATTANANEEIVFNDLVGGTYTIRVEDSNGCTYISGDIEINDQIDPILVTPLVNHPTCDPSGVPTSGSIELTATGGTAPFTFNLFNESNDLMETILHNDFALFENLTSGTYYIDVVDDNGCVNPLITQVVNPATTLTIADVQATNVTCFGDSNGEIEVTISGATGVPEFKITPGDDVWQTENIFTGLGVGSYTIETRDDNGCIVIWGEQVVIDQPTNPFTISLVGILPTSISTSDGRIDITPSGGTPPYTYELHKEEGASWIHFADSDLPVFESLPVGEYMVIAKDANGCIDSETITLTQYSFTLTATNALCFGNEDGTITVNEVFGSTNPLSVDERQWFNGAGDNISDYMVNKFNTSSERYEGLPADTYTLVATTADGADFTGSISVGQPNLIEVNYTISPLTCYTTDAVGEITFSITGGTPFADGLYDISWQDGETLTPRGNVVGGLAQGNYVFTISDANGCEHIEEVTIIFPEPITISSLHVYDLNCFEDNKGEISVWATGNTPTLTYRIEGPLADGYEKENNTGIFSSLSAGVYELFITDENGCEHVFAEGNRFVVNQPEPIKISMLTSDITERICHYDTVGVGGDEIVYMQVTGGMPDYTYQWTNNWQTYNKQTLNLEYPTPGTYEITVTDRNSCVATKEIIVPGPPPIGITFAYDTAHCKVFDDDVPANGGIIISNLTGGNGLFSLNEDGPNDFNLKWYRTKNDEYLEDKDNSWSLLGRVATGYYAVITDRLGCEEIEEFTIPYDENNRFDVTVDVGKDNYCYNDQGTLRAVIETENGIGTPTFKWKNVTDNQLNPDNENPYTTLPLKSTSLFRVDVISSLGCVESAEATVSVYPRIGPFVDRESHTFFTQEDLLKFYVDDNEFSPSDSTVISVLSQTNYEIEMFTENYDGELLYSWLPSEVFVSDNSKVGVMFFPSPVPDGLYSGQIFNKQTNRYEDYIQITGTVTSEANGCSEEVLLKARILDKVRTSNVFSPNDDGINDIWTIPYSDIFPDLEIKIFNRWGHQVWSAKGTEAARGWNGKNGNGKELPTGTYYYVIKFNVDGSNKWKPVSGSVTIIR